MVQAMVKISDESNQILNIVKARHNLSDKSKAIDFVVQEYGKDLLEPNLRPEFICKMIDRQKEKIVKIDDFKEHFGLR